MKRLALPLILFLSLGLNLGLLLGRGVSSERDQSAGSTTGADAGSPSEATASAEVPPRLERMVRRMAEELSLEGAEREEFFDVQKRFFARSFEMRDEGRRARRALLAEMRKAAPDRARAEALLDVTMEAQREMEAAFIANYFETRELLRTPKQKRLFLRFMRKVRQLRLEMERRQDGRAKAWRERRSGEAQEP
ncbi:MAG: periplasmic heavy metal sensor [Acidobacteriota bacterium]